MQRGVAIKDGVVVRGTQDAYLLAFDAETGELLWESAAGDSSKNESFTMPPLIFEDLVLIGPAGAERGVRGWVGAFSLEDGSEVWRFNTIPEPGEPGAETWSDPESELIGGRRGLDSALRSTPRPGWSSPPSRTRPPTSTAKAAWVTTSIPPA